MVLFFLRNVFVTFFINSSCFLKRSDALSMANNSIFISFVNGRFFVIQYENPVIFKSLILTHDGDKVQKLPKVGHFQSLKTFVSVSVWRCQKRLKLIIIGPFNRHQSPGWRNLASKDQDNARCCQSRMQRLRQHTKHQNRSVLSRLN